MLFSRNGEGCLRSVEVIPAQLYLKAAGIKHGELKAQQGWRAYFDTWSATLKRGAAWVLAVEGRRIKGMSVLSV